METEGIRAGLPGDFAAIGAIWQEAFGGAGEALAYLREHYTPAGAIVAEERGAVVGAAYLVFGARLLEPGGLIRACPYLYAVAVDKRYRGRGWGKALVRFAVRQAFRLGFGCVATCPASEELLGYYKDLGFTEEISLKERMFLPARWSESVRTLERGLLYPQAGRGWAG